jgi:hypothetical protein
VKAHLARHHAMLELDGDYSDDEGYDDNSGNEMMSFSVVTGSSDSSGDGEKSGSPLTAEEQKEIATTLNFHVSRRRAIAETMLADKFAKGLRDDDDPEGAEEGGGDDKFQRRFLAASVERSAAARQCVQPGTIFGTRNLQLK